MCHAAFHTAFHPLRIEESHDARLLGIIGQSKDALSINQIICKLKEVYPGSDWRYVYEMIDELCSSQPYTFAQRMFCASDLFSEDSDGRNKCSSALVNKLKKNHQQPPPPRNFEVREDDLKIIYPFFGKDDNTKTYVEKNANGKITKVTIKDNHDNSIVIESTSDESVGMTIIYAPRYYPNIDRSYNPTLFFPLVLKKKSGKIYAYEAARNFGNPAPLQYLDVEADGESKKYRLNFRGLVLLLLSENNPAKINAVLRNLSDVDTDIQLKRDSNGLSYSIKENFPFLSTYFAEFQKAINDENYLASCLKEVAKEVENKLYFMEMKDLKYSVTRKYYSRIESYEWRNGRLFYTHLKILPPHLRYKQLNTIRGFNADPKFVSMYKLSILYYIRSNIEEDLFLVDKMIKRNEERIDSISAN